jgi:hypothetical protein
VGVPLLLCTSAVLLYWWNPGYLVHNQVNWTKEEVEQKVLANIPKGMSRAEVEALFDKHGIPHHYFAVDENEKYGDDGTEAAKEAGLSNKDFRKWMRGDINEAEIGFLFVLRIHAYLFFDDQDKVIARRIKTVNIGL